MVASLAQPMVCVVDDDPDVLGSLRFLLETDGFDVRTFESGAALLKDSASYGADCFVVDYKMPRMNGLDLVSRLRSRDIVAPIILITGYLDKALPDRAANAGVHHVLRKPHLEESLPDHIREALRNRSPSLTPPANYVGTSP